jgi:hypothetical protein
MNISIQAYIKSAETRSGVHLSCHVGYIRIRCSASWIPTWGEEALDSPPIQIIEGQLHKNKLQHTISFKFKIMAILIEWKRTDCFLAL